MFELKKNQLIKWNDTRVCVKFDLISFYLSMKDDRFLGYLKKGFGDFSFSDTLFYLKRGGKCIEKSSFSLFCSKEMSGLMDETRMNHRVKFVKWDARSRLMEGRDLLS